MLFLLTGGATVLVGQTTQKVDYKWIADTADWGWTESSAGPLGCISGKYDLRIYRNATPPRFIISILDAGKEVYTWSGGTGSVFEIAEDRLYYIDFFPAGPGGTVIAVSLTTGKEIWRSPLKALSEITGMGGSAYMTRFNLTVNGSAIFIHGWETNGRYFEIKDINTGETVGHKIFPKGK